MTKKTLNRNIYTSHTNTNAPGILGKWVVKWAQGCSVMLLHGLSADNPVSSGSAESVLHEHEVNRSECVSEEVPHAT